MRPDGGGVGEGDEGVVVDLGRRPPRVELGVDARDGAEEEQRLVDEMATEVVEEAPRLDRIAGLAPAASKLPPPALEPRFESVHAPEPARGEELPDGQED